MAVQKWDIDTWSNDIEIASLGKNVPVGLYFYFVEEKDIKNLVGVIGNCNAITSCYYTPILEASFLELASMPYDTERFGKAIGSLNSKPTLYRILGINKQDISLGKFKKYYDLSRPERKFRDYRNESRLQNYPYSYSLISDGINIPLEVRYHEIYPSYIDNEFEIKADAMVTDTGSYSIYVKNLKGDNNGIMEGMKSASPTEIPVSSSAYANWSSTQKAQTNQNLLSNLQTLSQANAFTQENVNLSKEQAGTNALLGGAGQLMGGVGSAIQGNLGGVLSSAMGMIGTGIGYNQTVDKMNMQSDHSHRSFELGQKIAIGSKNAMLKDLSNTPRSMITTGSDVLFQIKQGGGNIELYRYGLTGKYLQKLGDYFAMFGYKQNRVMNIRLRSRRDYNYIKTVGANIVSRVGGRRIPKDHLRKLSEIFDNGVTIWHIDRNGGLFQNYTFDNTEMEIY